MHLDPHVVKSEAGTKTTGLCSLDENYDASLIFSCCRNFQQKIIKSINGIIESVSIDELSSTKSSSFQGAPNFLGLRFDIYSTSPSSPACSSSVLLKKAKYFKPAGRRNKASKDKVNAKENAAFRDSRTYRCMVMVGSRKPESNSIIPVVIVRMQLVERFFQSSCSELFSSS